MKNLLFILLLAVAFCSCEENRVPKEILIKKVSLTQWPTSILDNDGTGPDLQFILMNGNVSLGISETINDITTPPTWTVEKTMIPPDTYTMGFFELDGNNVTPCIDFYFNYRTGDDYPNPIRVSAEGYSVSVFVEYKF